MWASVDYFLLFGQDGLFFGVAPLQELGFLPLRDMNWWWWRPPPFMMLKWLHLLFFVFPRAYLW